MWTRSTTNSSFDFFVAAIVARMMNRPFPSSPQSLFQSESKCEFFVMVIGSYFNMNEN